MSDASPKALEGDNAVDRFIAKIMALRTEQDHAEVVKPCPDTAGQERDEPAATAFGNTDLSPCHSAAMRLESNNRRIDELRARIPAFTCIVGCHDCCGPVTASAEEMARLPVKSKAEHATALAKWSCPHLGARGCNAYRERPLICRLFGTTPRLPCPNGRGPVHMIDSATEHEIHRYLANTRQVLL